MFIWNFALIGMNIIKKDNRNMSGQICQDDLEAMLRCVSKIGFTGKIFQHLNLQMGRKYAKTLWHTHNAAQKINCIFQLYQKQADSLQYLLKGLLFTHLVIQESQEIQPGFQQEIVDHINRLLELTNELIDKQKPVKRSGIFSKEGIDRTVSWIRDRISTSKQKKSIEKPRVSDFSREKQKTPQNDPGVGQSREQFLYYKLVVPYASFLQKMVSSNVKPEIWKDRRMSKVELWTLINKFKSMVTVTKSTLTILRYYQDSCESIIINLIKAFDRDIKSSYPYLDKQISLKNTLLKQEYEQISKLTVLDPIKQELLKKLADKYELEEFKSIIIEIGDINEYLLQMYYGRYHHERIKEEGISCVKMIKTSTDFDVVFTICGVKDKMNKSRDKSISTGSKTKLERTTCTMKIRQRLTANNHKNTLQLKLDKKSNQETVQQVMTPVSKGQPPVSEMATRSESEIDTKQRTLRMFKQLRIVTTNQEDHQAPKRKLRL